MRMITLLIISGGLLLAMAAPVNAHEAGHRDYDQRDRYYYSQSRGSEMPRWLKRHWVFCQWYRHSSYRRSRALSWARVFEIYQWERRYARRYDGRRHYDHYDDRRRKERTRRNSDW